MHVSARYTLAYLTGSVLFMAAWVILFWLRPSLRREMAVMSGLAVLSGLPLEYFLWTRDWWHPPTIMGTRIGIEDLLFAIANGGLLAVLATVIWHRTFIPGGRSLPLAVRVLPFACYVLVAPILVLTGLHSFVATSISTLLGLAVVLNLRHDLAKQAVSSALIGLAIAMPVYWIMEVLFPGIIAAVWDVKHLSGYLITGVPVEDIAWYLYTAAFFGTYYKYVAGQRLATQLSESRQPISIVGRANRIRGRL